VRIKTAFGHVTAIPDGFAQIDVTNCDPQYILLLLLYGSITIYNIYMYDLIRTMHTLRIRRNMADVVRGTYL